MLLAKPSSAYKRSYRKLARSGRFPKEELESVIKKIQKAEKLDAKYNDHQLSGDMKDLRECHI